MQHNVDLIDLLRALNGAGAEFLIVVLGRAALIENKKAAGRPQDLADVAYLEARDEH